MRAQVYSLLNLCAHYGIHAINDIYHTIIKSVKCDSYILVNILSALKTPMLDRIKLGFF